MLFTKIDELFVNKAISGERYHVWEQKVGEGYIGPALTLCGRTLHPSTSKPSHAVVTCRQCRLRASQIR